MRIKPVQFGQVVCQEVGCLMEALIKEPPSEKAFGLLIGMLRHWNAYITIKDRDYQYPHTIADNWDGPEKL